MFRVGSCLEGCIEGEKRDERPADLSLNNKRFCKW